MIIINWIANEEMIDFHRFTNWNKQICSYRVTETHDKALKGRIDYELGTPSLASAIWDVSHIFQEYELTDHATTIFSIDFLPADKEPGVFSDHPLLL